jgi:hypothetical protein
VEHDDLLVELVGPFSNLREPPRGREFCLQKTLGIAVTRNVLDHNEYAAHPRMLRELRNPVQVDAPEIRCIVRFEPDLAVVLFAMRRDVLKKAKKRCPIRLGDYRCDDLDKRFRLHLGCNPKYRQGIGRPFSGTIREVYVDTATLRNLLCVL